MKIALIVPSLANKGPVLVARELATELCQRHCVEVLYFDDIHELQFPVPTRKIGFTERINLDVYDVVHSHCLRPDLFCALRRMFTKKPRFVTTLHNIIEEDLCFSYGTFVAATVPWIYRQVWRRFDRVIVLSDFARRHYVNQLRAERLRQVYNGMSIAVDAIGEPDSADRAAINVLKSSYVIIGVNAVLTARKGVDVLIDALPGLPNHALVVVGDGPERIELEALAAKRQVSSRVLFLGYRPGASRFMQLYDIYALPSRSEGLPMALIEALALGVPVACSELPVFREVLSSNEAAFFSCSDISSVINAMRTAADTGRALGVAGRNAYHSRFTAEAMALRHESVYTDS